MPSKEETRIAEKFLSDNLKLEIVHRLIKVGEGIAIVPHSLPIPPRSVFMAGVMLGEIKKGVLFPHHQFFSAYGKDMRLTENLKRGDERVAKYLRGEEIETDGVRGGWCCVLYEGVPLGGGKISGGRIKNHYPKGLRNK